jgi:hypothetical protein
MQRDQQRADQRADGDGNQRLREGQSDRDNDGAHDDVEHVDVAAEPERELVPGLAVPCPGRDVVDVPVLDVPAQRGVPRCGYSHLWFPFSWKSPFPGRLPAQIDDRLLGAGPAVPRHAHACFVTEK